MTTSATTRTSRARAWARLSTGKLLTFTIVSAAVAAGCLGDDGDSKAIPSGLTAANKHSLAPVATFHEADYVKRSRPKHVELSRDGKVLFVALEGNLIDPGNEVLALDAKTGRELARIEVGSSPQGMALSRDGKQLYVANQFSSYLTVIDVEKKDKSGEIPVTFYAQDIAVSEDAKTLYLSIAGSTRSRW